jgi:Zn-dependent M28 family amino/carboxypeptidase
MQVKVDPAALKEKLQHIVGERNPFSSPHRLAQVEDYVEREFKDCGLVVESHFFKYSGKTYRNIIGRLGGGGKAPLIIVGAHLDSVEGTPGADDNASGLAVLLEAARILANLKPRSPALFCAFNLEEQNMIGSGHFVRKLKSEEAKVEGMISLEMVGYTDRRPGSQKYPIGLKWFYPDQGDFIAVVGNFRSTGFLRKFARVMRQAPGLPVETLLVPGNGFLIPEARLSDHAPFWDAGYPALLVTDTSFFRNPHYHGSTDKLETLDLGFMAKVCEGVVTAVVDWKGRG